jgi:hypothetical protein
MSVHQNEIQNHNIETANKSLKDLSVQIFENDSNKSKLHSQRNYVDDKFWEYLLPFSSEYSVFPFSVQKHAD